MAQKVGSLPGVLNILGVFSIIGGFICLASYWNDPGTAFGTFFAYLMAGCALLGLGAILKEVRRKE